MKTFFSFVFCFLMLPWTSVNAGDPVGNGGGIAEHYVTFAYENIESYVQLCLSSESCQLTSAGRHLLQNIRNSMPLERVNLRQIEFKSEAKEPGFFFIDGQVRVARTGDEIGSTVYINTDLLYTKTVFGEVESISLHSAIAILVHELGHHHQQKDHQFLDVLGSKVATLIQSKSQEVSVNPFDSNIVATIVNFQKALGNYSHLLISDGLTTIDFSESLKSSLVCPSDAKIAYLLIWNAHWMREDYKNVSPSGGVRIPLRAQLNIQCLNRRGTRFQQDQDLKLDLIFLRDPSGKLRWVPKSDRILQIDCSQKPNDCH